MKNIWLKLRQQNWNRLGGAWFIVAGVAAVYYGAIQPSQAFRGVSSQKAAGEAAIENRRHEHWYKPNSLMVGGMNEGVVGGVPMSSASFLSAEVAEPTNDDDRKLVRTSSIGLVVEKPAEAATAIQQLAEAAGGFLTNWESDGGKAATNASLMVRVPIEKYAATMAEIRKLAQRVESERVQAQDVTRQYVDNDARLRNLRAQETQYLAILKQARTVKDTLEVSEKLNQVRGEIEQQQSEFNTLSKQVELVSVAVSLRREIDTQVFGLPWRPAYEFKFAVRQGLEGLLDYSTSILSFVFYLPAIVLWMATILGALAIIWRVLRWAGRLLFTSPKAAAVSS